MDLTINQKSTNSADVISSENSEIKDLQILKVGAGSNIFLTDREGSRWGSSVFDSANAYIKVDGSFKFKAGDGTVIMDSLGEGGNFVTILTDFTFQSTDYAGAFKSGNPTWDENTGLITGGSGVLINARGILGANAGVATFTLDATTGNATFSGTITGSSIIGGTIIGGTIKTATPGLATGSAVVIEGGINQIIKLYYNTVNVGTISGLQTSVGAETEYLRISASSGRFISLRGSEIAFDADIVQSGTHSVGQQAQPWDSIWAKSVVAYGSGAKFSINGADGQSNSFGIVTNIRAQENQARLEKKYRTMTFTKGLVT
jgi:hypothetical protein